MGHYALPAFCTVLGWWSLTGLILVLDGCHPRTFPTSLLTATAVLGAALWGLDVTSTETTVGAAYGAFACTLLIWGWIEMSFLMAGRTIGPQRFAQ